MFDLYSSLIPYPSHSMFDIIITNATIVNHNDSFSGDIGIIDDRIHTIAPHIYEEAGEKIEAGGMFVLPGCIDPHVHLRTPGNEEKEDFKTGTKAAIKGGYTTLFDMPNTSPSTISQKSLQEKRQLALKESYCNMGFYMGLTPKNIKNIDKQKNIIGYKMYMGSSTGDLLVDDISMQETAFKNIQEKILSIHSENESIMKENLKYYKDMNDPEIHSCIRSKECAIAETKKAITFAKKYKTPLNICHISTQEEVEMVRQAKKEKFNITCEVSPHHLFLDEDDYIKQENFVKVNPPLRASKDKESLWDGISDGTINFIASDHAPHLKEEKEKDYWKAPSGIPHLDTTLQILLEQVNKKRMSLENLVKITSFNTAKRFNIPKRGEIKEGFIADLIIVDLKKEWIIQNEMLETKCKWSPFHGTTGKGQNILSIIGGEVVYDSNFFKKGNNVEIF